MSHDRRDGVAPDQLQIDQMYAGAIQHYQSGNRPLVERICSSILQQLPTHSGAAYLLGILALDASLGAVAVQQLRQSTEWDPANATCLHALGEAYRQVGSPAQAIDCFSESLRLDPNNAKVHNSLGVTLLEIGDLAAAKASFQRALQLQPQYERAHNNLGRVLQAQGDSAAAAVCFAEAVRIKPDYAIACNNLGAALQAAGDLDQAAARLRQAIVLNPEYPEAHFNLGNVLFAQHALQAAAASLREAIRLRPNYAKAHNNLGLVLKGLGHAEAAVASFQTALRYNPDLLEAHTNIGNVRIDVEQWEAAGEAFKQVLLRQPDSQEALANVVRTNELLCDWRTRDADLVRLWRDAEKQLAEDKATAVTPFHTIALPWSAEHQLQVARSHSKAIERHAAPLRKTLGFSFSRVRTGRLRIGYLSADFHTHATSQLMQALFGLHDRTEFEVFAYSFGPDDAGPYRRRIVRDCDHFLDVAAMSNVEAARRIYNDGIHILVDLKGFTGHARSEIVAMRPAPIQVSYLGYPGTMGANFIDYLIGDRFVTPLHLADTFSEKLVLLPHSYQVNDHQQPIADIVVRRADWGLPPDRFVFCCFNNHYKIEPRIFGVWMNILRRTLGSVLWLFSRGKAVEANLLREAAKCGIDPSRLIFAGHRPKAEHLARHRLADLFLDTLYCNAHTTASDALWAGLPVLTCPGETFASRVAASLLGSVGLPELIAAGLENYEQLAIELASSPAVLSRLRQKLHENRTAYPLYDTPRFARNLERAYRAMWEVFADGRLPEMLVIDESTLYASTH